MDPFEAVKVTFFQECEEQLAELEAGLLALENGDHVLALVTQSHRPTIDLERIGQSKNSAEVTTKLAQDIESRVYQIFATRHPVKINAAVMRSAPTEE